MISRLSNKHTTFIHGNENYTQVAVMKILYRQFLNKKLKTCTTFYRASKHRPDTRAEITCTKTSCYMHNSTWRWRILGCEKLWGLDWSMQISFHEFPNYTS